MSSLSPEAKHAVVGVLVGGKTLLHPRRDALAEGEEAPARAFDLPVVKSTCTHHFRVLREAGVIRQRLEGPTRLNSLRREDLAERFPRLVDAVRRAGR